MAAHIATTQIQTLLAAGRTERDIQYEIGTFCLSWDRADDGGDIYYVSGLKDLAKINAMVEALAAEDAATEEPAPAPTPAVPARRECTVATHDHDNHGNCYDCGGYRPGDDLGAAFAAPRVRRARFNR